MVRTPTKVTNTVLLLLLPLLTITGCAKLLGVEEGLAPEDEPYLFDRWDPDFQLAEPCHDISDTRLRELGLRRIENEGTVVEKDGLSFCTFATEDSNEWIDVSGVAVKLAQFRRNGILVDYQLNESKAPSLAFRQDEYDDGCRVAAETPRGSVQVGFNSFALEDEQLVEKCQKAEEYFDLLIGEKLNEYRTN